MSPLDRINGWLVPIAADHELPPVALRVAILLAYRTNSGTGDCRPSMAGIARDLGIDERSAQRGARALERRGHLAVEHPAGRRCCTYKPLIQPRQNDRGSTPAVLTSNPGDSATPTPADLVANPGRTATRTGDEQEIEQEKEQEALPSPTIPLDEQDTLKTRLKAVIAKPKNPTLDERTKLNDEWYNLIDVHELEPVTEAAEGCHKSLGRPVWPSDVRKHLEQLPREIASRLRGIPSLAFVPADSLVKLLVDFDSPTIARMAKTGDDWTEGGLRDYLYGTRSQYGGWDLEPQRQRRTPISRDELEAI